MVIDDETIKNEIVDDMTLLHVKIKYWTREMQKL